MVNNKLLFKRLRKLTFDFVIVGDINIDIITRPIRKLEKEISIIQDDFYIFPGGNAANTALELAKLGASVHFIGALGKDPISKWLIDILKKNNITYSINIKDKPSGITFAITHDDGSRTFIATLGSNKVLDISDIDLDNISATHFHRAGYLWAPRLIGRPNKELFKMAKKKEMVTSLAFSWDPDNWTNRAIMLQNLDYCDILMLNEKELKALTGETKLNLAKRKLKKYYHGLTVIHRGSKGSLIISEDEEIIIPAKKINILNPTGSGDIYDAAFLYGYEKGWNLREIGKFAGACAEIHIQNPDIKYPSLNDIDKYLKSNLIFD